MGEAVKSAEAERIDHDTSHLLEEMFAEGYRSARDKLVYLRLAHIPFEMQDGDGGDPSLYLQGVRIEDLFEVGSASPAFGSAEMVHHMYPHGLVRSHVSLRFLYVGRKGVVEKPLHEVGGLEVDDTSSHHHL